MAEKPDVMMFPKLEKAFQPDVSSNVNDSKVDKQVVETYRYEAPRSVVFVLEDASLLIAEERVVNQSEDFRLLLKDYVGIAEPIPLKGVSEDTVRSAFWLTGAKRKQLCEMKFSSHTFDAWIRIYAFCHCYKFVDTLKFLQQMILGKSFECDDLSLKDHSFHRYTTEELLQMYSAAIPPFIKERCGNFLQLHRREDMAKKLRESLLPYDSILFALIMPEQTDDDVWEQNLAYIQDIAESKDKGRLRLHYQDRLPGGNETIATFIENVLCLHSELSSDSKSTLQKPLHDRASIRLHRLLAVLNGTPTAPFPTLQSQVSMLRKIYSK